MPTGERVIAVTGGTPAASGCATGTTLYRGSATSFTHAVAAKSTWSYRLCAVAAAGNVSTGTARTATAL